MKRAVLAPFVIAALAAAAQSPEELRALIDKGDARAAYELGRRAPQRLGDPAFDLYFGIAAVNAGHASEGVLALERFVLANPGHDGARLELARGYFLMGDDGRAREEFEAARARNPAPAALRVIDEHLAALRAREGRYRPTAAAWAELGAGYDSNPRAGVDNPVISLPTLGEVTIADTGVRISDRMFQAGAGLRITAPVTPRLGAFAAAQMDGIRYRNEDAYNQALYAGSVGFSGALGPASWRAGASIGYQTLGHDPYLRTGGLFTDWTLPMGSADFLTLGLQGGTLNYQGVNDVRDSEFGAVTAGWRRAFALAWTPQLEASVNTARERNNLDTRQDLSRDLYGAHAGVVAFPFAKWSLAAGVSWQRSRYREPDPVLETTRDDRYLSGYVSVIATPWRDFTVRLELTDARNSSNIALYEYRRWTAVLRGRHDFR